MSTPHGDRAAAQADQAADLGVGPVRAPATLEALAALRAACGRAGAAVRWVDSDAAETWADGAAGLAQVVVAAAAASAPTVWLSACRLRGAAADARGASTWIFGAGLPAAAAAAALARHGKALPALPAALRARPLGELFGAAQEELPAAWVEAWPVARAWLACDAGVREVAWPGATELRAAEAIAQLTLVVGPAPVEEAAALVRFGDGERAVAALRALVPWRRAGGRVRLAPQIGLERGALWGKAPEQEASWRVAVVERLPTLAAWADRALRHRSGGAWWLQLSVAGELGVTSLRLREGLALTEAAGGEPASAEASASIAGTWPEDQPLAAALAAARGMRLHRVACWLDWEALHEALAPASAGRAWLQVHEPDVAGARLEGWLRRPMGAPSPSEEALAFAAALDPKGAPAQPAAGSSGAEMSLGARRPGSATAKATSQGSRLRWAAGTPPSLWASADSPVSQTWAFAAAAGYALALPEAPPAACAAISWADLLRREPAGLAWLLAAALPDPDAFWRETVVAMGSLGAAAGVSLPGARGPLALRREVEAAATGAARPYAVRLALRPARPRRLLRRRAPLAWLLPRLIGLRPLLAGSDRAGLRLDGDGAATLDVEIGGHDVLQRRAVDAIAAALAGSEPVAAGDAPPWPTSTWLTAVSRPLEAAVAPGAPWPAPPAGALALVALATARPLWLVAAGDA